MRDTEIEARALVLEFMHPIDELHKYPMCFDTAKQCVLMHIHKTIIELKEFDNQDGYAGSRIDYFEMLQTDVKKM
jgi:hypothetical protein